MTSVRSPLAIIALGLLLLGRIAVEACSCGPRPTVLDSFEGSKIVATMKLVSVDKIGEKQDQYDIRYIRSSKLLVQKVYKGNVKPGDALTFAQGGGADCVWTFDEDEIGHEYLFYLADPTKGHPMFGEGDPRSADGPMYYAIGCGRSSGIAGAKDDLSYLNNLSKVQGKTRLSGQFRPWYGVVDPPDLGNIKIHVVGKSKTWEIKTDKEGFYELYDLPPGDYFVKADLPFGWKYDDYMLDKSPSLARSSPYERIDIDLSRGIPVRIPAKGHAALDLYLDIDTAITGKVLGPDGSAMPGVCLTAVSTELKEGDYRGHSRCTDEKGFFVIDEMQPGNYRLVVNDDGKMSGKAPFGILFYPGVTEYKSAGVIRVDAGKYVKNIILQVPSMLEIISITGKFLLADGSPAKGWVKFTPDIPDRYDEANVETDNEGNFRVRLPAGAAGRIKGERYSSAGEFEKCPDFDKAMAGARYGSIFSRDIYIDGRMSLNDVELKLPFPACEKAKHQ